MKHRITPVEWEHYLDGDSPPSESEHIESHLTGCQLCWNFHQRLAALNAQLREAGEIHRNVFSAISDEKLRQGLQGVYGRIHATHTAVIAVCNWMRPANFSGKRRAIGRTG
jgi:anti-sigma factor RsiW